MRWFNYETSKNKHVLIGSGGRKKKPNQINDPVSKKKQFHSNRFLTLESNSYCWKNNAEVNIELIKIDDQSIPEVQKWMLENSEEL